MYRRDEKKSKKCYFMGFSHYATENFFVIKKEITTDCYYHNFLSFSSIMKKI
ncbi:Uncharacterized protein dnm_000920 [Desulfonema magnum]|uniref:Uncharacterized protein n=1 Tax=Desulfonema magnum TaxID=45655 RepID=A0A975BF95_9BACT|nr:Uncharacterized protein dnm_000920 [Desulfonema magnum]